MTVRINCLSGLKIFANSVPSASNFKSFSRSMEQFFLTEDQINFGNKIPILVQDFDKDTSVGPQFTSLLTTSGNTVSLLSVKAIETCIILSTMGITKKICFEKRSLIKPAATVVVHQTAIQIIGKV